jgi:hypothetical protein
MTKSTRIVIGVILSAIFWPLVFYLALREPKQSKIAREGVDAVATIRTMEDQHETRHDSRALMRVTVAGVRNGAPFEATVDQRMTEPELVTYRPGTRVAIKYDAKSPGDIVLLGPVKN